MAVAARFIRQVGRFGLVLGLAAWGFMARLGMPFRPDTCAYGTPCQIIPIPVIQPSLIHRFGLLAHGYWPAALLSALVVAGVTALTGMGKAVRDRQVAEDCLRRVYC